MEEIKNWWGVFGLFDCVTVLSSSLERRCHRQGSLTALTNLHPTARAQGVLLCVLKRFFFFSLKWVFLSIFPLTCVILFSSLWFDVLVGSVHRAWNGTFYFHLHSVLKLFFKVMLDSHLLYVGVCATCWVMGSCPGNLCMTSAWLVSPVDVHLLERDATSFLFFYFSSSVSFLLPPCLISRFMCYSFWSLFLFLFNRRPTRFAFLSSS